MLQEKMPHGEPAHQLDPVVKREAADQPLQRLRVDRDREERGGEQEHRHQHELDVVELGGRLQETDQRDADGRERERHEQRGGQEQQRPPRRQQPHDAGDRQERHRIETAAHHRPRDLAERDVQRTDRGRQHRVVRLGVAQFEEQVVRALENRAVHRRRRQQRGRDERDVAHRLPVRPRHGGDQLAETDLEREQVEQRLERAGHQDRPRPSVDGERAFDQRGRAAAVHARGQHAEQNSAPLRENRGVSQIGHHATSRR